MQIKARHETALDTTTSVVNDITNCQLSKKMRSYHNNMCCIWYECQDKKVGKEIHKNIGCQILAKFMLCGCNHTC